MAWPFDFKHLLAQVDEEAALEQAVKFCQVHLGAAAQRQVSRPSLWQPPYTGPAPAEAPGCRPRNGDTSGGTVSGLNMGLGEMDKRRVSLRPAGSPRPPAQLGQHCMVGGALAGPDSNSECVTSGVPSPQLPFL